MHRIALFEGMLFGEPSNPCKRGNTDVKPMMMMTMLAATLVAAPTTFNDVDQMRV
jgi:hypothetical protein